jgi:hypothetical protein
MVETDKSDKQNKQQTQIENGTRKNRVLKAQLGFRLERLQTIRTRGTLKLEQNPPMIANFEVALSNHGIRTALNKNMNKLEGDVQRTLEHQSSYTLQYSRCLSMCLTQA